MDDRPDDGLATLPGTGTRGRIDAYPTRRGTERTLIGRRDPVVYGAAGDGPLDAAALDGFDRNGYVTGSAVFTDTEVGRYRAELTRLARDADLAGDERVVTEHGSGEVRSIFEVHRISQVFAELVTDPRVLDPVRQLLGSDVYIHQSRVNYKPGFAGRDFYWHSDFETWHAEDGMPRMRAVSASISLTDNLPSNGSLMIIPGSHRTFVGCVGETPDDHYRQSLRNQEIGTPDRESLSALADRHGIDVITGPAGSMTIFDCNCMHGSNGNITPFPRSNVFVVFNSVENRCGSPFAAPARRPPFIAARTVEPLPRVSR